MADVKTVDQLDEATEVFPGNLIHVLVGDEIDGYTSKKVSLSTISTLVTGDVNFVLDAINGEVV